MLLSVSVTSNRERPVSDQDASDPATAIEALFGGQWGVWRSDTGWWWAARTHALTADDWLPDASHTCRPTASKN
jgi:hypothetical protein